MTVQTFPESNHFVNRTSIAEEIKARIDKFNWIRLQAIPTLGKQLSK
jgi:hypothetical protein